MPSQFRPLKFSLSASESELNFFKAWFSGETFLGERDIVRQLSGRPHMCCLLASLGAMPTPDMIHFELTLQGLFRTDLAFGNDRTRQFVLLEFEDARADSIFSGGTRQYRYWSRRHWSRRLEHGIGQAVDWAWLRSDHPSSTILTSTFGGIINDSAYIVVCGRDDSLIDDIERRRFDFRRHKMRVEGTPVQILTYDGMVKAMELQLANAKSFALSP